LRKAIFRSRSGVSNLAKGLVIVIVILLFSVLIYYYLGYSGNRSTQSSTSSSQSSGGPSPFALSINPSTLVIAAGLNETYPTISVIPLAQSENGSLTLSAVSNSGLRLSLSTNSVVYSPSATESIPFNFSASPEIEPGDYSATVTAQFGTQTVSDNFTIEVVQALVVMLHEAFIPNNITVPAGTTVVWMNIDTEIGCCDPGYHTVTFDMPNGTLIPGMSSQVLHRFDEWSYTFESAGTYHYFCTIHPNMLGVVTVT